ncbi:MAG: hypothetical protein RMK57_09360 [Bryobacterales bacterium]|nr:outer membrane lipoprotein-sorting protein [Bryobacteraceae bacterium]MDW8354724.1 hypothetical protein [Bryobacterales bacterium]
MRLAVVFGLGLVAAAAGAAEDPREIVRRSVEVFDRSDSVLQYDFMERTLTREFDADGRVKKVSLKTHEVVMAAGTPCRRLVERDGKPLPAEEQREQEESLRKCIEARRSETPEQKRKRQEEFERRRKRYQKAIREIPDAFRFRLEGEESVDGRRVWVIAAEPNPDYRPRDRFARLFPALRGRLWINQQDWNWVRLEAELTDTVTFGWILVRIHQGSRVRMEQTLVGNGVWLPSSMWLWVSLRVGLVRSIRLEEESRYWGYRPAGSGQVALRTN